MAERRVALITGASNGIGLEAAKQLALAGVELAMICRSEARGQAAIAEIEACSGHRPTLLLADLMLQSQVRAVAAAFREQFDRLDVLINHAGYAFPTREVTEEGFERTFALNYLAYFTLTMELLDLLKASAPARIINTASNAHRWEPIDFDNLQGERRYGQRRFPPLPRMYGWTNMYRIMFTYELAERLAGTGVVANCLCPGFVPVRRSGSSWLQNAIMWLFQRLSLGHTPAEAAETITRLALSEEAATWTGKYFREGREERSHEQTYDRALRARLWEHTLTLTGRDRE